jgi:DNA-binding NtrC family response regulator
VAGDARREPRDAKVTPLILLVENDPMLRLRGANELLDEGYEVIESESASEATRILEGRCDFDAMIADVSPGVPGILALLGYAKIHHPDMAIMVDTRWATLPTTAFTRRDNGAEATGGTLVKAMRRLLSGDCF